MIEDGVASGSHRIAAPFTWHSCKRSATLSELRVNATEALQQLRCGSHLSRLSFFARGQTAICVAASRQLLDMDARLKLAAAAVADGSSSRVLDDYRAREPFLGRGE